MRHTNPKIKLFLLVVLFGCCIGACFAGTTSAEAYSNRKQVKTALKKTQKKMKKEKAAYCSAKKKKNYYKKKSRAYYKGAKPIFMAPIACRNPLVVYQAGTYYRISNSGSHGIWFGKYLGFIRLSGGYTNINGYYCRNATAVISPYEKKETRATLSYKKHLKKYNKLAKQKNKLKKALTFKIPAKNFSLYVGNSKNVKPKNTYYNKINLTSSNSAVAQINGTTIRGVSAGSATITATHSISGKKTSFKIEVRNKKTIELNYSSYYLEMGKKIELEGKDWDPDREDRDYEVYTWSSSNSSVAKVSSTGKVTAVGYGSAVITVSSDKEMGRCYITVIQSVKRRLDFEASSLTYTQDDVGTQKTIRFTSNIPDLQWYTKAYGGDSDVDTIEIIHIDKVDYHPDSDPRNMVSGSITITIKNCGKSCLEGSSYDYDVQSEMDIIVSGLFMSDSIFPSWSTDEKSAFYGYGNVGELISVSGFDSSILSCEIKQEDNQRIAINTKKAGKTTVTVYTSTGYSRTFPITVYGINLYDQEGNLVEQGGGNLVKEYESSLDSYTEEELTDYVCIESVLPESTQLEIVSTNKDVIKLGKYVDGKQYFSVNGFGNASINAFIKKNGNYWIEERGLVNIHIKQAVQESGTDTN
ncbi:MAG: Ig-like domain-containing protein [Eubacterium sp.]|nr:Ig-like domain-containing protein [Eubacterium sp.]